MRSVLSVAMIDPVVLMMKRTVLPALSVAVFLAVLPACKSTNRDESRVKVLGGIELKDAEDPIARSVVSLKVVGNGQCTGVLGSWGIIITAAHCLVGSDSVTIGFVLANYRETGGNSVDVEQEALAVHPVFNDAEKSFEKRDNDIGLIFFDASELSSAVRARYRPARLATSDAAVAARLGGMAMVAGYGLNDTPEFGEKGQLVKASVTMQEFRGSDKSSRIKIGKQAQGQGMVDHGDSGGPLYVLNDTGQPIVLGINVMGGAEDGLSQGISVANAIPGYFEWMADTAKKKLRLGTHPFSTDP